MIKRNLLAIAIAATPLMAQAQITSATLYPSHGQLTWSHTEQASAGDGMVEIEGLPVSLQDKSLQVMLEGVPGSRVHQVEIRRVEQNEFVADETRKIREELAGVTLKIQEQKDAIQSWNQQVTLMSSAAGSPHELSASELNEMATALRETTRNALAEIRGIRAEMADNLALKDRLERELSRVRQKARATKNVQVRYQAPESGELQVQLRFNTPEAGWHSEYRARLTTNPQQPARGDVALEHLAVVQQTTGLDWQNVDLHLSTANARRGTKMPPIHSWVVSPEPPQAYRAKSSAPMADASTGLAMESAAVVERESTFTRSYRLQQPVGIDSGSSAQRLLVSQHHMPVDLATWTAPVQDTTGYLQATGTFETESPLPAGRLTLYRDGQSVGESRLPEVVDGEELTLGFGVDEGIRIAVINELERSGEEGIWKNENVQRRQNRFEITNHHAETVQIRVFDRLPVSEKDILTVKPLDISEPVQRNVDDKKGVLAWDREVPAGETITLRSGFEVRVPEGTPLPRL